ncbi:hypothetical protein ATANTOWER_002912 [Ataeniobius toweri]|uniref:Secreted protein n=1 Tax=Ataeniobius toweri TaxID=208326 RepID=A0ABU7BMU8_9TELE|nr:hypothetical protein [Ataeniobius toweri]
MKASPTSFPRCCFYPCNKRHEDVLHCCSLTVCGCDGLLNCLGCTPPPTQRPLEIGTNAPHDPLMVDGRLGGNQARRPNVAQMHDSD